MGICQQKDCGFRAYFKVYDAKQNYRGNFCATCSQELVDALRKKEVKAK
jgi:hypothetical protein